MLTAIGNLDPIWLALIAGCFTWGMTAVGAGTIMLSKTFSRKALDGMLGFAAGVMISASFWSLLGPAVAMSRGGPWPPWFAPSLGFIIGVAFVGSLDRILPHLHLWLPTQKAEGIKTNWTKSILLFLAITLHNFPEGLAIGVMFGAVAAGSSQLALPAALALTLGMGLQNLPEGMAIAVPLRREGMSRFKSFWYGQLSAVVEPIGAVIGAATIGFAHGILPYASGFAAGAMMFVVVEELIPESQSGDHPDVATFGTMLGFVVMMILDVAFS